MEKPAGTVVPSTAWALTSATTAPAGPCQKRSSIIETAPSGPEMSAVTEPSGSLRTQPPRPSRTASSRAQKRKLTPCTRPVICTL